MGPLFGFTLQLAAPRPGANAPLPFARAHLFGALDPSRRALAVLALHGATRCAALPGKCLEACVPAALHHGGRRSCRPERLGFVDGPFKTTCPSSMWAAIMLSRSRIGAKQARGIRAGSCEIERVLDAHRGLPQAASRPRWPQHGESLEMAPSSCRCACPPAR